MRTTSTYDSRKYLRQFREFRNLKMIRNNQGLAPNVAPVVPVVKARPVDRRTTIKFLQQLADELGMGMSTNKSKCHLRLLTGDYMRLTGECSDLKSRLGSLGWKFWKSIAGSDYYLRKGAWPLRCSSHWKNGRNSVDIHLEGDIVESNMKHQYYEALARIELSNGFEPEDAELSASTLRAGLASFLPFVVVGVSTLGGKHRPTITIKFSLDPKSDWVNGIMQNSRYALMQFHHDGSLEYISGKIGQQKFRKSKVRDVQSAIKKIQEWVEKNK